MRHLFAALFLLLVFVVAAGAEGLVSHAYFGANGVWLDGPAVSIPNAVEAGGSISNSISPHISAVGETFFGLSQSYVRWSVGGRATITDALNPNFNSYVGIRCRGGSTSTFGPLEWAPDAGVGWRPFPGGKLARLLLGGDAGYGLTSTKLLLTLGVRWEAPLK